MARRRRRARHQGAPAFRPSAPISAGRAPTRSQAVALLCGLVLIASGIAVASYVVKPAKARSFNLFYGSMYINDNTSPVAVDLASGKPTVRLTNAYTAVAADSGDGIDVYPLGGGNTLLLNPQTGEFNMVDSTGFVVKSTDGGVPLPRSHSPSTSSMAVASGSSAYIVRRNATSTSVYLVSAATVSAAVGSPSGAKARAYATVDRPLSDEPVPAVGANNSLWLLTETGANTHAITELSVPAGSNAGVTLAPTRHGSVTGPAAVGTATSDPDGTGVDVPAVASSGSIAVFRNGKRVDVPVSVGSGIDRILPASNAHGTLVFLYHSADGWSQVSVPAAAGTTAHVSKLSAIPADAQLAVPARSDGRTYTMDTTSDGALWQVDSTGTAAHVPGVGTYPLKHSEQPQFGDAQVLADGTRVIFNARANLRAEVVFSDGSHTPRAINKHAAAQVDPSGATALADAHSTGKSQRGKSHKPTKVKHPTQTINDKINCNVAKQVPRVPTLIAGDRAARSISLTWVYTKLDPSDCYPSTFEVDIKVLSSGSPSPAHGQVKVQGQNGVTLTGLFPATEYELTVTAYINSEHTSSAPIDVTTGPEGPAAPTDVRATTDASGNWTVSWNSCGGIAQGCVPSATWNLIPSFCDGRGLSNAPAKVTVAGDPTQHSFTHVYAGSDALLGRGMCFAVQGVSPDGTIGTTSSTSPPAYSWTTPDAAGLTLTASQPANTDFGGTTTTTVDLGLGADPVRTVGGVGATIALHLSGPGTSQTKTITWDGRLDRVATTFTGIRAGGQYTASASVAAPRHSSAVVTKGPVTVTTRANWPSVSASASCPPSGGSVTLNCNLVVQLSAPSSATANGERFDLTDSDVLCGGGNSSFGLTKFGFDPANDAITQNVDLLQYNGSCTVNIHLVESGPNGSDPEVFGGTTSPLISTSVDLGHASTLDAGPGDFSTAWDPHDGSSVLVRYTGGHSDGDIGQITQNWQENIYAPDGTPCGQSTQVPTHGGVYVDVNPASCVNDFGNQPNWRIVVSYQDRGTSNPHSYPYTLSGEPPGYVPCTVSGDNFGAAWSGTGDAPSVDVTFTSGNSNLAGCSNWQYTVVNTTQQGCGSGKPDGDNPSSGDNVTTVAVSCDTTISTLWHVEIDYNGPEGQRSPLIVQIDGTPPTPTPTPTPTTPDPTTSTSP